MSAARDRDPAAGRGLPTISGLAELAALVDSHGSGADLYIRWSKGPDVDLDATGDGQASRDALTGVPLPGLSASPLAVEPWWGDRSTRVWVARRLYDYRHLRELRGPGVRPWVLVGSETGRGPDNEPLVACDEPVAWIAEDALEECERTVRESGPDDWGPLNRARRPGTDKR